MPNPLVACFSATGTTLRAAETLASVIGAELYEIKPAIPYKKADLNWLNPFSRSSKEMKDTDSRPALADKDADIASHDVIFLGFPIWWYIAPTIINTFLESYDFSGKTIVLFATSGGSKLGKTAEKLRGCVSDTAVIKEGIMLNGKSDPDGWKAWAEQYL
ncbi:MAG: flavodoxin [Clostridia bacterium]|nr:flavodoxin [Clostridia bacterium]